MNSPFQHPQLLISAYRLHCSVQREVHWVSYAGSVIHGISGKHLKQHFCILNDGNCDSCNYLQECGYGLLVHQPERIQSSHQENYIPFTHPFRVSVFPWSKKRVSSENVVTLDLVLFGRAIFFSDHLLKLIINALQVGVGRAWQGKRGYLEIIHIENLITKQRFPHQLLFTNEQFCTCHHWSEVVVPPSIATIELTTPTEIHRNKTQIFQPTLLDFLVALQRRLQSIAWHCCQIEELTFPPLPTEISQVKYQFEKHRVPRYSSRQELRMWFEGVTGSIDCQSLSKEWYPYLTMGELVGIGKKTTFGFGSIRLS